MSPSGDTFMESPLFDHDLDDYPWAGEPAGAPGKPAPAATRKALSPSRGGWNDLIGNLVLFYAGLTLGPLLLLVAAIAPGSSVGRSVSRPAPGMKAGLTLWRYYLGLLAISQLGLWLLPIAALAPRALHNRTFERWAGMSLCFLGGMFLLMLLATSSQLLPIAAAWPYPCAACLLGLAALAADYLRRSLARFRSSRAGDGKEAASFSSRALFGLGFLGGSIPPALRVLVVWGMIGGTIATLASALDLATELREGPGDAGEHVAVLGDGTVRGVISRTSGGPRDFGDDDGGGGGYSSGGSTRQESGRRGWVHFRRGGLVAGEGLVAEMKGRGIAFEGRAAIRSWRLANLAFTLVSVLLVVASAIVARGEPIGLVLYGAWATISLAFKALLAARVPESAGPEDLVVILFAGAALAILRQPAVRGYLGRPPGHAAAAKPPGLPRPEFHAMIP